MAQQNQAWTELRALTEERDGLKEVKKRLSTDLEQIRSAKEQLSKKAAEVSEMLRSQEGRPTPLLNCSDARRNRITAGNACSGADGA